MLGTIPIASIVADSAEATGLKWQAPAGGGGFTKITSADFSAQSSVAIDDCFTSTYKTYYVFWYATASVGGADVHLQFRYAGPTTETTNEYYGAGFGYDRSNSLFNFGWSGQNQAILYPTLGGSGEYSFGTITITDVGNSSQLPKFSNSGFGQSSQSAYNSAGLLNVSRIYTGFLLKPDSGTITGRYQVYGLAN